MWRTNVTSRFADFNFLFSLSLTSKALDIALVRGVPRVLVGADCQCDNF